jgi:hypothetical protein
LATSTRVGLAQHRSAHLVLGEQSGLGGQPLAGLELAGDDSHAEVAHDARMHALPLRRLAVVAVSGRRRHGRSRQALRRL